MAAASSTGVVLRQGLCAALQDRRDHIGYGGHRGDQHLDPGLAEGRQSLPPDTPADHGINAVFYQLLDMMPALVGLCTSGVGYDLGDGGLRIDHGEERGAAEVVE